MDVRDFLSDASVWTQEHLSELDSWAGHVPFAVWLVASSRPRVLVDLSPRVGEAYFAFCQSVESNRLETRCFAVETHRDDTRSGRYDDSVYECVDRINRERYSTFSTLIDSTREEAAARFRDGEIDLLHIDIIGDFEAVQGIFETWIPKLSDRGVILLHGTNARGAGSESAGARYFEEVSRRYRAFHFPIGSGLGMVLVGDNPPEILARLAIAGRDAAPGGQVREMYARLGSRIGPDHGPTKAPSSRVDGKESLCAPCVAKAMDLESERSETRRLRDELTRIQESLSWKLITKAKRARGRLIRPGSRIERGQAIFARGLIGLLRDGPGATIRRLSSTKEKLRELPELGVSRGRSQVQIQNFDNLPWRLHSHADNPPGRRDDRFQIVLVSHDATRSGAPLALLRLAEELSRSEDLQCWVVALKSGELVDSFAQVCPTLDVDAFVSGRTGLDFPDLLADLFSDGDQQKLAILSSAASGPCFYAFQKRGIPVLGWIHELYTVIEMLGGQKLAQQIASSARKLIVPTRCVKDQICSQYGFDEGQIEVINYGVETRPASDDIQSLRNEIRKELSLPDDAEIILGCGSIEVRKGTDLFVQLGKTLVQEWKTRGTGPAPYFVWVGRTLSGELKVWLDHDIRQAGVAGHFRFVPQTSDPTPYFQASDVFVLTSREETFALVCVEAMLQGVPVVGFRDAGGSSEIIEGCGHLVDYLDVEAMTRTVGDLLKSPEQRKRQGLEIQRRTRGKYTWGRFGEKVLEILREDYGFQPAAELGAARAAGGRIDADAPHRGPIGRHQSLAKPSRDAFV